MVEFFELGISAILKHALGKILVQTCSANVLLRQIVNFIFKVTLTPKCGTKCWAPNNID